MHDRRLEKSTVAIFDGGLDSAIARYADSSTPRIVLAETVEERDELLEKIDSLAEVCDAGTQVIVLGNVNDVQIYRSLVQQGISDYLVPPLSAKQIFDSVAGICADPSEAPLGRVISFMGARGGTGSSTVAHNTAWCLTNLFDEDIAVLDLDLAFGTVGLAFNLEAQQGVHDALTHPERLDEMLLERFMAKHEEHLFLLTSPGSLQADADIDPESFDVLLNLVRRTASFAVLDVPHGWAAWTRHALSVSDEIVVTATADLANLRDAKNLLETLNVNRANDPPIRIVLNHFGAYRKTQLSAKDFESAVGDAPTLVVPHEPVLFGTAANNGQMVGEANKRSKIAAGFESLAKIVCGRESVNKKKKKSALAIFKKKQGKAK
ncbi:MAG: CpaE family protein [Alphaproteobacteria bacterium]